MYSFRTGLVLSLFLALAAAVTAKDAVSIPVAVRRMGSFKQCPKVCRSTSAEARAECTDIYCGVKQCNGGFACKPCQGRVRSFESASSTGSQIVVTCKNCEKRFRPFQRLRYDVVDSRVRCVKRCIRKDFPSTVFATASSVTNAFEGPINLLRWSCKKMLTTEQILIDAANACCQKCSGSPSANKCL